VGGGGEGLGWIQPIITGDLVRSVHAEWLAHLLICSALRDPMSSQTHTL
jgi:hypothetical protein